ncbi:histidine phosphatase family protein, partial [Patescibacteria group bacterium]|nr:histidine phosphatase family protein [Patescibacteria group bacterium]
MSYLVLVRHTESIWNKKGLWTGWTDIDLDEEGLGAAKKVG